jgi:hypothetical protein
VKTARTYRNGHPLSGFAARNAVKTHCPAGHEYDATNTRWWRNEYGYSRGCLLCHRDRARARRRVA